MNIDIIPFHEDCENLWDEFLCTSRSTSFQHSRKFLKYHKDRFKDKSLLLFSGNKCIGLFPAAESNEDRKLIISHPGATYGGIVNGGWLSGNRMVSALQKIMQFYQDSGYHGLIYKAVPFIYTRTASQDDLYALYRVCANRRRCDLSSAIDFSYRFQVSRRRKRGLNKSRGIVELSSDLKYLDELWEIILQNLLGRHNSRPTHTLDELKILINLFPENIVLRAGLVNGKVEGGLIFFNAITAWHIQYSGATPFGHKNSVLDLVIESAINEAEEAGARYFDFGISNENEGQFLNDGLYRFKSEFGGGGMRA